MLLFWMILFELELFYWARIWKVLAIAFISGLVCVGKTGVTELYREFEWSNLDFKGDDAGYLSEVITNASQFYYWFFCSLKNFGVALSLSDPLGVLRGSSVLTLLQGLLVFPRIVITYMVTPNLMFTNQTCKVVESLNSRPW
jgi:hypothetical protein